jgi:hypothetical protein
MTELQAKFRRGALVNEFHDRPPRVPLDCIPQPRAAWGNAPLRRNAGHFGVDEAGTSQRTVPVVNEMPVVRHPIFSAVLRHRRDHNPVGQLQTPELEWQKHGRARVRGVVAFGQPALVVRHKTRIAKLEILVTDALTTRKETVSKLLRWQVRVARHVLEPLHAITGRTLQLQDLEMSFPVIGSQGRIEVGTARDMAGE